MKAISSKYIIKLLLNIIGLLVLINLIKIFSIDEIIMDSTENIKYALLGVLCGLVALCFGFFPIKKINKTPKPEDKDQDQGGNQAKLAEVTQNQSQSNRETEPQIKPKVNPKHIAERVATHHRQKPRRRSLYQKFQWFFTSIIE